MQFKPTTSKSRRFTKALKYFSVSLCIIVSSFMLLNFPTGNLNALENDPQTLELASFAAVLMDVETGQILYEKNMQEELPPASITKILTALLALEKGDLSETLTMSHDAVFSIPRGSSHIALDEDEQITLEQAMYAMMLVSANDAANGIAEYISGSEAAFAELMNQRAKQLGAKNTHFVNANGLTETEHYTCAYDMALFTREAMQNPDFNRIWSAERYEMSPTNKQPEIRIFNNQNRMLINTKYQYPGVVGGKLGWTTEAKNTMVVAATQNDRTLLCVLLKTQDPQAKYQDAKELFDYGFNDFRRITLSNMELPGEYSFLLHQSVPADKVKLTYDKLNTLPNNSLIQRVTFALPDNFSNIMYPLIGSTTLVDESAPDLTKPQSAILITVLVFFLKALFGLFILLFILACFFRTRRRLRRRKRQLAKRNQLSDEM